MLDIFVLLIFLDIDKSVHVEFFNTQNVVRVVLGVLNLVGEVLVFESVLPTLFKEVQVETIVANHLLYA